MIHSKATVLPVLLGFGLLPIFASTAAHTDRGFLPREPRISQTRTTDDPQSSESSLPGKLRWIRGTVLSWTSDSLTLQPLKQGKKALTLELSLSQQIIHTVKGTEKVISVDRLNDEEIANKAKPESLAVGSAVQAHYFEQHNKFYAIVIIEEKNPIPVSQKMSGSSYLGVFEKLEISDIHLPVPGDSVMKIRALHVRIDGRTRRFYPYWRIMVDSRGHRLAAPDLKAGDALLITYRLDADGVGLGTTITTPLEIRNLTPH
jgi:hypothetical protein